MTTPHSTRMVRNILGGILLFVALNAFGGGYYGLSGAKDIPVEWLRGSPFSNYFIPSLILVLFVGLPSLVATILIFRNHHLAQVAGYLCGLIILLWIIVQVAIIGFVSWLQPVIAITGCLILILTRLTKPQIV